MTSLPEADQGAELGGRLPLLHPANLMPEQKQLYQYLRDTKLGTKKADFQADLPDGRLLGPFNALLYRPELGRGFLGWIDAESQHTSLAAPLRQLVILAVTAVWHADYELYAHSAMGLHAGLSAATIRAIKEGREPVGLAAPEAAAYRFTRALVSQHQVPDELYQQTVAAFGLGGVVELVHLIGHYLVTSALLNAFAVPAPKS